MNYFTEEDQTGQFIAAMTHMVSMMSIIPEIRYARVYMLEELATNDINFVFRKDPDIPEEEVLKDNDRINRVNLLIKHIDDIRKTIDNGITPRYTEYLKKLREFAQIDICLSAYETGSQEFEDCTQVSGGDLTRGLFQAIFQAIRKLNWLMDRYYEVPWEERDDALKRSLFNSVEYDTLLEIQSGVGGPIKEMLVEYRELFDEFKADNLFYHRIKYSGFVVFLSFFMIFAWIPFM